MNQYISINTEQPIPKKALILKKIKNMDLDLSQIKRNPDKLNQDLNQTKTSYIERMRNTVNFSQEYPVNSFKDINISQDYAKDYHVKKARGPKMRGVVSDSQNLLPKSMKVPTILR